MAQDSIIHQKRRNSKLSATITDKIEKLQKRRNYQAEYRRVDYAKLHRQVWLELHPEYFAIWREKNPDYFKVRYRRIKLCDPYYSRECSRKFRRANPDYYKEYRARNRKKLRRYWRMYKRKKRKKTER